MEEILDLLENAFAQKSIILIVTLVFGRKGITEALTQLIKGATQIILQNGEHRHEMKMFKLKENSKNKRPTNNSS